MGEYIFGPQGWRGARAGARPPNNVFDGAGGGGYVATRWVDGPPPPGKMPPRPRPPRRKTAAKPDLGPPAPAGKTADRRDSLVAAARGLIAERGFEGLRTREVARRVGLNHATLHHYFPTKEALIEAVVHDLVQQLTTYRAAQRFADMPPRDALHAHFAPVPAHHRDEPGTRIALQESFARSRRDAALANLGPAPGAGCGCGGGAGGGVGGRGGRGVLRGLGGGVAGRGRVGALLGVGGVPAPDRGVGG